MVRTGPQLGDSNVCDQTSSPVLKSHAWSSPIVRSSPWKNRPRLRSVRTPTKRWPARYVFRAPFHRPAQVVVRGDVQKAGRGVVCGRRPVRAAPVRRTELGRLVDAGFFRGIVLGPAGHRIDAGEDVLVDERPRVDEADGVRLALEKPQVPVPARMHEARDRTTVAVDVDQQGEPPPRPNPTSRSGGIGGEHVARRCRRRSRQRSSSTSCRPAARRPSTARRCRCPST